MDNSLSHQINNKLYGPVLRKFSEYRKAVDFERWEQAEMLKIMNGESSNLSCTTCNDSATEDYDLFEISMMLDGLFKDIKQRSNGLIPSKFFSRFTKVNLKYSSIVDRIEYFEGFSCDDQLLKRACRQTVKYLKLLKNLVPGFQSTAHELGLKLDDSHCFNFLIYLLAEDKAFQTQGGSGRPGTSWDLLLDELFTGPNQQPKALSHSLQSKYLELLNSSLDSFERNRFDAEYRNCLKERLRSRNVDHKKRIRRGV